jgi:IrrE N-terminal-like domain
VTAVVCGECGARYGLASDFELGGPCRECGEEALLAEDDYDAAPAALICVDCRREVDGGPPAKATDFYAGRYSVDDPCPLCEGELVPLGEEPSIPPVPELGVARAAARRLRGRHGAPSLPTDVEALARAEGLRIVRHPGLGEPYLSEGEIHLPAEQHRGAERFGIAHELGHHELRHRVPESRLETEANAFAAERLIPAAELRRLVGKGYNIRRLAAAFAVSREAITRALTGARLINEVALA